MAADQDPGLERRRDPRQGMATAHGRALTVALGGGQTVPLHHVGTLVLEGLLQEGGQGV